MLFGILVTLHIILCILLVALVLLQVGRGMGILGFLGGGTAEALFGSRAGDILTRSTVVIAVMFMCTSLVLAYLSTERGSVVSVLKTPFQQKGPAGKVLGKGKDILAQKGAELVQKAKEQLMKKIPLLGTKKTEKRMIPKAITKSKISYDKHGNKIADEWKYDSSGKPVGHYKVWYDRTGKEIKRKKLPLNLPETEEEQK